MSFSLISEVAQTEKLTKRILQIYN